MKNSLKVAILFSIFSLSSCSPTLNPSEPTNSETPTSVNLITEKLEEGRYLNVGDQMYDIHFTDINGIDHSISKELETKDLIIVNFFASWCAPCKNEFSPMQEVQQKYSDDVTFFALTVETTDTIELLKQEFQDKYSVTFPIGYDTEDMVVRFFEHTGGGVTLPMTVFIDRYGTIVETHNESIFNVSGWEKVCKRYIGDKYVQPSFDGSSSLDMPDTKDIENLINDSSYSFGYYGDEDYPWYISEEESAIYPSNSGINSSTATIHSDFEIKETNKKIAFDYLCSTEKKYDVLNVKINDQIVFTISGLEKEWKTFEHELESGTYKLTLTYEKDSENKVGDDLVFIKNLRLI